MEEKIGKWVRKSTKKVHSGMIFDTYFDKVIRPDGKDGEWSYITVMPGVCVVPVDEDGNVYLINEFRYPIQTKNIEVIGGGINPGESALQAAKRELKEESGIVAEELINFGTVIINPSCEEHKNHCFIAKGLSFVGHELDATEEIQLICISLETAIDWCMNGKINNVETIALLFKVQEILNNKN